MALRLSDEAFAYLASTFEDEFAALLDEMMGENLAQGGLVIIAAAVGCARAFAGLVAAQPGLDRTTFLEISGLVKLQFAESLDKARLEHTANLGGGDHA